MVRLRLKLRRGALTPVRLPRPGLQRADFSACWPSGTRSPSGSRTRRRCRPTTATLRPSGSVPDRLTTIPASPQLHSSSADARPPAESSRDTAPAAQTRCSGYFVAAHDGCLFDAYDSDMIGVIRNGRESLEANDSVAQQKIGTNRKVLTCTPVIRWSRVREPVCQ